MRFFLFLIFLFPLSAGSVYHAFKTADLEDIFIKIWNAKKKERVDFAHANVRIILHQGFYKIACDNSWVEDLLFQIRPTMVFKAYPSYLQVTGRHLSGTEELITEGGFEAVLLFLDNHLKKGLKVSGELYYEVWKEPDFARSLIEAARNNSDTIIRLRFCETDDCVQEAEIKEKIKKIYLFEDDGMSLIIHSRYNSQELPKIDFFRRSFYPFVKD